MTRKLYDADARLLSFSGRVLSCEYNEKKSCYEVILDQTAFFPEEGGQMPDQGVLDGQTVTDVQLRKDTICGNYEETIVHMVKDPINVGAEVTGTIDWNHRFDQMQQHSGEHIISGLIHHHYGLDNVGFHLGAEEVTLDFNGTLTLEQLRAIEKEANEAIKKNFPVEIAFPDPETLKNLNYRSKIELKGPVRIVTFPGYDICACCAPHVERTGEIGLIKITNVQSHRGGVRVNILCGDRAIADYTQKQDSVSAISVSLSAPASQIAEAVEKLKQDNLRLKEQICALQAALMETKMASLPSPADCANALLTASELDAIASRNTANQLADTYPGFGAVLVGSDETGYRFVIASRRKDCRELASLLRKEFGAKGGGSAEMIQGNMKVNLELFKKRFMNL